MESVQVIKKITFGRKVGDVIIEDDEQISGKHLTVYRKDDEYFIIDHHSTNQTRVNGQVIPPGVDISLSIDDKIQFGNQEYILSDVMNPSFEKMVESEPSAIQINPESEGNVKRMPKMDKITESSETSPPPIPDAGDDCLKTSIVDLELSIGEKSDIFDEAVLQYKDACMKEMREFEAQLAKLKRQHQSLLEENFKLRMKLMRIERNERKKAS